MTQNVPVFKLNKKNIFEWAAVHADILVLYKVRHQRFPKFTWYTVYTYKTTKFFKCIKGSLSECIQQILESCGDFRLEHRSSSAAAASVEREQRHWGAETNPLEYSQTQLDWLHHLHVFPEGATGWFQLLLGSDWKQKAQIQDVMHWMWEKLLQSFGDEVLGTISYGTSDCLQPEARWLPTVGKCN